MLGYSHHEIYTKSTDTEFELQHSFKAFTDDNQWLQVLFDEPIANVQWVRIVTLKTPSYVAWRTVHVYGMRPEKRVTTPPQGSKRALVTATETEERETLLGMGKRNTIPKYLMDDITNTVITDKQIRALFNQYDVDHNGWISADEVKAIYNSRENFSLLPSQTQIDSIIHKYNLLGDKRISYDEFAIIMLTIAKW
eukprot:TRINITY_DN94686_c0_g1_i1.p1 TRINITY_DN94686_c0_g1~~TRINITY_DN94686_c0_g1_i1.p1  ORF type:complete len:224 (-),score=19.94 TRINITY_DN94686_c0_g1_i1:112-696(-)